MHAVTQLLCADLDVNRLTRSVTRAKRPIDLTVQVSVGDARHSGKSQLIFLFEALIKARNLSMMYGALHNTHSADSNERCRVTTNPSRLDRAS